MSFKTIFKLSGAVWKGLAFNKKTIVHELSHWKFQAFPLFHDLSGLIKGDLSTGELMEKSMRH
ncbi:hypothetical protein VP01_92g11 [Puccinia sorghi]|uniref:Uncharacterized protein n=1 Tax=Puccinia sorghi TaxID=27349 RepID=A0A0L6U728_9BASI|nr:hypothetical protein VP01_92g11 [Puccinia sorghi]